MKDCEKKIEIYVLHEESERPFFQGKLDEGL
jgi:hypothetical protein